MPAAQMSSEQILDMLQGILEREFEIPASRVLPAAQLAEDLDLDSLDAVVLAMSVEERTRLKFSAKDLESMHTVQQVVDTIQARL